MVRRHLILAAAVGLLLGGCKKPAAPWGVPTPSTAPRPVAIPGADARTLASPADVAAAGKAAADPGIMSAVKDYLGAGSPGWQIVAARDLGDYELLWISFPHIADGGIAVVYSKRDGRILWQFNGGELG